MGMDMGVGLDTQPTQPQLSLVGIRGIGTQPPIFQLQTLTHRHLQFEPFDLDFWYKVDLD